MFFADKTKIYLSNVKLNNNFEVLDFKKIEVKTFLNEVKNNDFVANKLKKVVYNIIHLLVDYPKFCMSIIIV